MLTALQKGWYARRKTYECGKPNLGLPNLVVSQSLDLQLIAIREMSPKKPLCFCKHGRSSAWKHQPCNHRDSLRNTFLLHKQIEDFSYFGKLSPNISALPLVGKLWVC